MVELLHATGVRLGLVTNGDGWMLVDAPASETTAFITWLAPLWVEEHETVRAFRTLLGVRRFFGVTDDLTLEGLLAESARNQQEVTEQLGSQVRHAVEILVRGIDRINRERVHRGGAEDAEDRRGEGTYGTPRDKNPSDQGGEDLMAEELTANAERRTPNTEHRTPNPERPLVNVTPKTLYDAALTVMMRLVFLLSAEECGLLLLGTDIYDENYAVSTLRSPAGSRR
jgi:hypothetical protein